jgi:acetyl esterase/lipase
VGAEERRTHDRLVRERACGAGAAVAFVDYDRSPEARYPAAIEQGYATARWIVRAGAGQGLDPERAAVAQAIATLRQALHTA